MQIKTVLYLILFGEKIKKQLVLFLSLHKCFLQGQCANSKALPLNLIAQTPSPTTTINLRLQSHPNPFPRTDNLLMICLTYPSTRLWNTAEQGWSLRALQFTPVVLDGIESCCRSWTKWRKEEVCQYTFDHLKACAADWIDVSSSFHLCQSAPDASCLAVLQHDLSLTSVSAVQLVSDD